MIRWQRDFGIGLGFLGSIVVSIFLFPGVGTGLGILSGFFIAKAVFDEEKICNRKPEAKE